MTWGFDTELLRPGLDLGDVDILEAARQAKDGHPRGRGQGFFQQLESLRHQAGSENGQTGDVPAGAGQARDDPLLDGIAARGHDDGDRRRRPSGRGDR
jgi:hypothetical protein